ncbi:MAG: glutamate--tRNA ligase, partial [Bacteroidota bacterium]|nr:glutamate--tRNA ligase [Bacteroidota bacterium]
TDQSRFVSGAEEYIYETLKWCGLEPDESPLKGGPFGPYRQSERKGYYREFADKLIRANQAYYAFDTPQELEEMRVLYRTASNPSPQYDQHTRIHMRNSLTIGLQETQKLLDEKIPYVIRIKIPPNETLKWNDLVRGPVEFNSSLVDDKVLLKADGMPTYHLAVVVDDFLMKITHAFRGEEWLPSAPVHILLWRYLFGEEIMPAWAHFPLILKPDGNGKLSKRDAARLGIPIFAMDWKDAASGEIITGFREKGFLPEAFVNMLAVLGWNDGTEQELYSLSELVQKFAIERVHKSGAKFNYEKAKWFNQEWIRKIPIGELSDSVRKIYNENHVQITDESYFRSVIQLICDRCHLLPEFYTQGKFFYDSPKHWDLESVIPKWTDAKRVFFRAYIESFTAMNEWNANNLETGFKDLAAAQKIKAGELQLPFRIMLAGEKTGPPVFEIAALLGRNETAKRINNLLAQTGNW